MIAVLMILAFVFPSISWAFEKNHLYSKPLGLIFKNQVITLPEKLGTISQQSLGQNRLVVHIQDLHCNYEVQKNIYQIIDWFAKHHDLKLVGIEGASLPVNVTKLSTFPDQKVKKEVGEFFVKQGKMSGAEWYAATGHFPIFLEGVEQPENYQAERDCLQQFFQEEMQGQIYDLKEALNSLKPVIYNQRLKMLDAQKTKYCSGTIRILDYARFLSKLGSANGLLREAHPQVSAYLARQVDEFSPEIDPDQLLGELEALDQQLKNAFYTSDDQRSLDLRLEHLEIMEKLLNISATPEELAEFRAHPENYRVAPFLQFIASHAPAENDFIPEVESLDRGLEAVSRFYELADQRSTDFVENLTAKMQDHQVSIAILLSGGYHTDQIRDKLAQRNIGYLSIKPRITRPDLLNPYFTLLKNRQTPLEKLLAQNQEKYALAPFFMQWLDAKAILKETDLPAEFRIGYLAMQFSLLLWRLKTISEEKTVTPYIVRQAHDFLKANYLAYNEDFKFDLDGVVGGKRAFMLPLAAKDMPLAAVYPANHPMPENSKIVMTWRGYQVALYPENQASEVARAIRQNRLGFRFPTLQASVLQQGHALQFSLIKLILGALGIIGLFVLAAFLSPHSSWHLFLQWGGAIAGLALAAYFVPKVVDKVLLSRPPTQPLLDADTINTNTQLQSLVEDIRRRGGLPSQFQDKNPEFRLLDSQTRQNENIPEIALAYGKNGQVFLPANFLSLPYFLQRAMLQHELFEAAGKGHWRASKSEYGSLSKSFLSALRFLIKLSKTLFFKLLAKLGINLLPADPWFYNAVIQTANRLFNDPSKQALLEGYDLAQISNAITVIENTRPLAPWKKAQPQGAIYSIASAKRLEKIVLSAPLLRLLLHHFGSQFPQMLEYLLLYELVFIREGHAAAFAKVDAFVWPTGQASAIRPRYQPHQLLSSLDSIYFEDVSRSSRWEKLNLIMSLMLENPEARQGVGLEVLLDQAEKRFVNHGLKYDLGETIGLLDALTRAEILRNENEFYFLHQEDIPWLRAMALKFDAYDYMQKEIIKALKGLTLKPDGTVAGDPRALLEVLAGYDEAMKIWPRYKTETRYPMLKVIAMLEQADHKKIIHALESSSWKIKQTPESQATVEMKPDPFIARPLADSILKMLDPGFQDLFSWVKRFLPRLVGRTYYYLSAEFSIQSGGLGRVGQYLLPAMKKLGVAAVNIEPYYQFNKDGLTPVHYPSLPTTVTGFDSNKPDREFLVYVGGKPVKAYAYRGINHQGVETWMIRDENWFYTKALYYYNDHHYRPAFPTTLQFSEFFSKASIELIKELEEEKHGAQPEKYLPPIIHGNDGQLGMFSLWHRLYYTDSVIAKALCWFTTHTYFNRAEIGQADLERMQIPKKWWWVFMRTMFGRVGYDLTSCGIRTSQGRNAVSAKHEFDVAPWDPIHGQRMLGATNGDWRKFSAAVFQSVFEKLKRTADQALQTIFPENADPEYPTPEQVIAAKREAKATFSQHPGLEQFKLDPDRPVISYSGRYVWEKNGRARAFTDGNIEAWVKAGAQVVIFGNYMDSWNKHRLGELQAKFRNLGYPGQLIFLSSFDIDMQRALLAASDLQIQDSDFNTEAAGYTESDITANAGLQMGPPWIEGILQRQGIILDQNRPGWGSTIIPADSSPEAYREAALWLIQNYLSGAQGRLYIAKYQATAVRLSRVLSVDVTDTDYLREFDWALANPCALEEGREYNDDVWKNEVSLNHLSIFSQDIRIQNGMFEGNLPVELGAEDVYAEFEISLNSAPREKLQAVLEIRNPETMIMEKIAVQEISRLPGRIRMRVSFPAKIFRQPGQVQTRLQLSTGLWNAGGNINFLVIAPDSDRIKKEKQAAQEKGRQAAASLIDQLGWQQLSQLVEKPRLNVFNWMIWNQNRSESIQPGTGNTLTDLHHGFQKLLQANETLCDRALLFEGYGDDQFDMAQPGGYLLGYIRSMIVTSVPRWPMEQLSQAKVDLISILDRLEAQVAAARKVKNEAAMVQLQHEAMGLVAGLVEANEDHQQSEDSLGRMGNMLGLTEKPVLSPETITFSLADFQQYLARKIVSALEAPSLKALKDHLDYLISPDTRPLEIDPDNLGLVLTSNLMDLGSHMQNGHLYLDPDLAFQNLQEIMDLFSQGNIPGMEQNLTFHAFALHKASYLSRLLYGLDYNQLAEISPGELVAHLNARIKTFGKEEKISVTQATIQENFNPAEGPYKLLLELDLQGCKLLLQLSYPTKHSTYTVDGKTINLDEIHGNPLSAQGADKLSRCLTKQQIRLLTEKAHTSGAKAMADFVPWRSVECLTPENYRNFVHWVIDSDKSNEELLRENQGQYVILPLPAGKRAQVARRGLNQDQLQPDFGKSSGTPEEQRRYNYWRNIYQAELKELVDLGFDSFRVDSAYDLDPSLLFDLVSHTFNYASAQGRKIYFLLESHTFFKTHKDFQSWNQYFDYPVVKTNSNNLLDPIQNRDIKAFCNTIQWLFMPEGRRVDTPYGSNYNEESLKDLAHRLGVDEKGLLGLLVLFTATGSNGLVLLRDFLNMSGERVPMAGGQRRAGVYSTQRHPGLKEMAMLVKTSFPDLVANSGALALFKLARQMSNLELNGNKVKIQFKNGTLIEQDIAELLSEVQRIAKAGPAILPGASAIPSSQGKKTRALAAEVQAKLQQLRAAEHQLSQRAHKTLKKWLDLSAGLALDAAQHLANRDEFWNFIKSQAWQEQGINDWELEKLRSFLEKKSLRLQQRYLLSIGLRGDGLSALLETDQDFWNFVKTRAWQEQGINDWETERQKKYRETNSQKLIYDYLKSLDHPGWYLQRRTLIREIKDPQALNRALAQLSQVEKLRSEISALVPTDMEVLASIEPKNKPGPRQGSRTSLTHMVAVQFSPFNLMLGTAVTAAFTVLAFILSPGSLVQVLSLWSAVLLGSFMALNFGPRFLYRIWLSRPLPPEMVLTPQNIKENAQIQALLSEIESQKHLLPANYRRPSLAVMEIEAPNSFWKRIFQTTRFGQGRDGRIELHPKFLALHSSVQRAVLLHEIFEAHNLGHGRAMVREYSSFLPAKAQPAEKARALKNLPAPLARLEQIERANEPYQKEKKWLASMQQDFIDFIVQSAQKTQIIIQAGLALLRALLLLALNGFTFKAGLEIDDQNPELQKIVEENVLPDKKLATAFARKFNREYKPVTVKVRPISHLWADRNLGFWQRIKIILDFGSAYRQTPDGIIIYLNNNQLNMFLKKATQGLNQNNLSWQGNRCLMSTLIRQQVKQFYEQHGFELQFHQDEIIAASMATPLSKGSKFSLLFSNLFPNGLGAIIHRRVQQSNPMAYLTFILNDIKECDLKNKLNDMQTPGSLGQLYLRWSLVPIPANEELFLKSMISELSINDLQSALAFLALIRRSLSLKTRNLGNFSDQGQRRALLVPELSLRIRNQHLLGKVFDVFKQNLPDLKMKNDPIEKKRRPSVRWLWDCA